jgi:D-alanine-D-alanine ligase-like ATP-grasp enzyme
VWRVKGRAAAPKAFTLDAPREPAGPSAIEARVNMLTHAIIAYETESAAHARLIAHGYSPEIAAEIAVYLAQATDLPAHMQSLSTAFVAENIALSFVELDALPDFLASIRTAAKSSILWCQTDGVRFYRGSSVSALARLLGIPRFGAPPTAQHLCQDKFASLTLAAAAGLPTPPTLLLDGEEVIAQSGSVNWERAGDIFVKPNTLGAKLGIFADSRCEGLVPARALSRRIRDRYADRAVVQPYIEGDDIRVSFLDTGGSFRAQLGLFRLAKDPNSETGGAFMTMRDNETLSGAADTSGARGGFGSARPAAFTPHMADLRTEAPPAVIDAIETAAERLARLLGLTDLFSMDLRLDRTGRPHFLEFEVCPAVTIYDFQTYLRQVHGLPLGPALARSMRRAHGRAGTRVEA